MPFGRSPIQAAADYSARAHEGQRRKDGRTPYAAHPYRVAMLVRHGFGCEDEPAIVAALLHDVIEDTPADYDEVQQHFGSEVADIVAALSKNMLLPDAQREPEYDRRLAAADWRARLIKLADVLDNLADLEARPDVPDRPAALARHAEKCRRALTLAQPDAHRPETARARALVEAALRHAAL